MKLTKSKLQQIIKEELQSMKEETPTEDQASAGSLFREVVNKINDLNTAMKAALEGIEKGNWIAGNPGKDDEGKMLYPETSEDYTKPPEDILQAQLNNKDRVAPLEWYWNQWNESIADIKNSRKKK